MAGPSKSRAGKVVLVLVILVVVGAVGFAAAWFGVINRAKDGAKVVEETGISTANISSANPPQYDLHLQAGELKCEGKGDQLTASGSLTNKASSTSDYEISVEFRQNNSAFANGQTKVQNVPSGATQNWSVTVSAGINGQFSCKVVNVNRYDQGTQTPN